MKTRKGYAECLVTEKDGYSVVVCLTDGTIIEQCREIADQLDLKRLTEDAKYMAKEMLENHNIEGNINIDFD